MEFLIALACHLIILSLGKPLYGLFALEALYIAVKDYAKPSALPVPAKLNVTVAVPGARASSHTSVTSPGVAKVTGIPLVTACPAARRGVPLVEGTCHSLTTSCVHVIERTKCPCKRELQCRRTGQAWHHLGAQVCV